MASLTQILGKHSPHGDFDVPPCAVSDAPDLMRRLENQNRMFKLRVRSDLSALSKRNLADRRDVLGAIKKSGECGIVTGWDYNPRQRRKTHAVARVEFDKSGCDESAPGEFGCIVGATCTVPLSIARVMIGRDKYGVIFEEVDAPAQGSKPSLHPREAASQRELKAKLEAQEKKIEEQADQLKQVLAMLKSKESEPGQDSPAQVKKSPNSKRRKG